MDHVLDVAPVLVAVSPPLFAELLANAVRIAGIAVVEAGARGSGSCVVAVALVNDEVPDGVVARHVVRVASDGRSLTARMRRAGDPELEVVLADVHELVALLRRLCDG